MSKLAKSTTQDKAVAWAIHLFTTSGVLWAFLAVIDIARHRPGYALLWLLAAQIVDGLDGPLARKYKVSQHVPVVDGRVLDLVVDYLTCVAVPVAFAIKFDIFPHEVELWAAASILYVSAIWFARTDIETRDVWFRGFPAVWNLVITFFWLLGSSQIVNLWISSVLIVLTLTPKVKFFHMLSSPQFRNITVPFTTIMMGVIAWMVTCHHRHSTFGRAVVLGWAAYAFALTIWRSLQPDELE